MRTYTNEEIGALLSGITPGEWKAKDNATYSYDVVSTSGTVCHELQRADAEFIAAASAIVAQLQARVEELEAENAALQAEAQHRKPGVVDNGPVKLTGYVYAAEDESEDDAAYDRVMRLAYLLREHADNDDEWENYT